MDTTIPRHTAITGMAVITVITTAMAMAVRMAIPGTTRRTATVTVTEATPATMATPGDASTTGAVDSQSDSTSKNHQDTGLALLWGNLWQRVRYFGHSMLA